MNPQHRKIVFRLISLIVLTKISLIVCAQYFGKLINTHAQYDEKLTLKEVVEIVERAGIWSRCRLAP